MTYRQCQVVLESFCVQLNCLYICQISFLLISASQKIKNTFFPPTVSYGLLSQEYACSINSDHSLPSEKQGQHCGYVDIVIPAVLTFLQVQTYVFYRCHEKDPSENPVVRICPRVFKGMGLTVF